MKTASEYTPAHDRSAVLSGPIQSGQSGQVTLYGFAGLPVLADVDAIGTGKPVVFLHGLVGLNDHWDVVVQRTKPIAKCILLQLPLLDLLEEDCSIHGATELTIRFLENHVREPAIIVGNSFGGHVALKIAIQRPDLVRGLILAGSSGLIEASMVSDVQIRPSREWIERKIGELYHDRSKMNRADIDRSFAVLSQRRQARAIVKLSRSARRNHLGDELGKIQAPALLVWGHDDIVTPPEACHQFASGIKNNKVVWLENCGHVPMIELPEEFAAVMAPFIQGLN